MRKMSCENYLLQDYHLKGCITKQILRSRLQEGSIAGQNPGDPGGYFGASTYESSVAAQTQ